MRLRRDRTKRVTYSDIEFGYSPSGEVTALARLFTRSGYPIGDLEIPEEVVEALVPMTSGAPVQLPDVARDWISTRIDAASREFWEAWEAQHPKGDEPVRVFGRWVPGTLLEVRVLKTCAALVPVLVAVELLAPATGAAALARAARAFETVAIGLVTALRVVKEAAFAIEKELRGLF